MFIKPKGTKDYFGIEQKHLDFVTEKLQQIASNFNYSKITTPVFEDVNLFERSSGKTSEIVSKQMFLLEQKSSTHLALRPEGTAPIVRAVLENKLLEQGKKPKLFYIEKMYRYEQPQKGRLREFFQFGVENFGDSSIENEIEMILFSKKILESFEITNYKLHINFIGDVEIRNQYSIHLQEYFKKNKDKLSIASQEKILTNPLRILDSKDQQDISIIKDPFFPSIRGVWFPKDQMEKYEKLKAFLDKLNIGYVDDFTLIRGLDYYNDFVFEFVSTDEINLGVKSTLIGGGRYDSLVGEISNNQIPSPAIGFALGIERLMLTAKDFLNKQNQKPIDYYVVSTKVEYNLVALELANKYRNNNNIVELNLEDISFSKKLEKAIKLSCINFVIIGDETKEGFFIIKNLITKTEKKEKIK